MDLASAAEEYARSTQILLDAARLVRTDQLERHAEGGWSPRQILHHVADSETQSYVRLRRLPAEPAGSLIQGYDEAAWAACDALGYRELAVQNSLRVFGTVRSASLDVLGRLDLDDLERYGEHSGAGRYTLAQWLDIYTAHPREHVQQLKEAVAA